ISGEIGANCKIGNQVVAANSILFAKFSSAGNLVWNKSIVRATTYMQNYADLTIDNNNNIYFTCFYTDSIRVGTFSFQTSSRSGVIAKADINGNWLWAKEILSAYASYISTDKFNNIYLLGGFSDRATINNLSVTSKKPGTDNLFLAKIRGTDGSTQLADVYTGNRAFPLALTTDSNGNAYIAGVFVDTLNVGIINFYANTTKPHISGAFLAKINFATNSIKGRVFADYNNNGTFDASEPVFPGVVLQTNPLLSYGSTTAYGEYSLYSYAGNYSVTIPQLPKYYSANPASHQVSFSGTGIQATGKDFALIPTLNQADVQVTITSQTLRTRPGSPLSYRVTYQNVGTTPVNSNIALEYDAILNFDSATVTPTSTQGFRLTWPLQNLKPTEKHHIDVYFTIPTTAARGAALQSNVSIPLANDVYPADNK
ncbi:MAG: hypothetical protein LPK21_10675, partial [Hymenobacteraceae bacterium]|nr:hypothetical protein [Hymenobacteraceae bacterium]